MSTERLAQHLEDPSIRILESSVSKEAYDAAHIPGALWVDAHRDLLHRGDDSSGYVLSAEEFAALMLRLGVSPATTVVWYGDRHSSFAIRGFWTMDHYCHPGGSFVLDGGRERWLADGCPTTSVVLTAPRVSYPAPSTINDESRATWLQTLDAISAPNAVVLDVRSDGEYGGTDVRAARGGRIPAAAHVEWTDATADANVLKSPDELRALYEAQGVTPDEEIVTYCQLGIRAAHSWFVLKHVLGYPRVRLYDGSWQEWGNRGDLPVER